MPIQQSRPCCSGRSLDPFLNDRLFYLLEKVSAVALGVFSAFISMELFLTYFLVGSAIGIYQYFYTDAAARLANQRTSTCSQGLLEQLTGAKLPPLASLVANLAVTWCHIQHHTAIFVPIVGVSLGAWTGQTIGHLSNASAVNTH
jgi:hypothetical protein